MVDNLLDSPSSSTSAATQNTLLQVLCQKIPTNIVADI